MEDHTLDNQTPQVDNVKDEAVTETAAPEQQDTLLAGKFKSKEDLISSTAELVKKVEGRDLTPTEVLGLTKQSDEDLSNTYKGLERQFHTGPSKKQEETPSDDSAEVEAYLNDWAQKNGFVRKDELQAQKYEEEELSSYFAQNPSAKAREDLIRKLSKMDGFTDKSFAEVDNYIISQVQTGSSTQSTRPSKMGQTVIDEEKSLDDYSDDEFMELISGGSALKRRR